jgi:hypothetical protein
MPAAQQTSGRLGMQRLGLNIYSWQPRKENARICRVECVRHKPRARSLRRGWRHRGK